LQTPAGLINASDRGAFPNFHVLSIASKPHQLICDARRAISPQNVIERLAQD
jgi:hypothetical protein